MSDYAIPPWMIDDIPSLSDSIDSIQDAFNEIRMIISAAEKVGYPLTKPLPREYLSVLSMNCITLYNESDRIIKLYETKYSEAEKKKRSVMEEPDTLMSSDKLMYLQALRNHCAHAYDSKFPKVEFQECIVCYILPMEDCVMSTIMTITDNVGDITN